MPALICGDCVRQSVRGVASMPHDEVSITRDQRVAALCRAANTLQARYPLTQCNLSVHIGPNRRNAHAQWCWPGFVRVTIAETGQLIAVSRPGEPMVLCAGAIE